LTVGSAGIATFLASFIDDFNNLNWPRFRARFRNDATVFFPQQYQVHRAAGREETDAAWGTVFKAIRAASGKDAPPFMRLDPQEVIVQALPGAAIVTFTLQDRARGTIGRRTMVLVETDDGWRIVHLHASAAAAGPAC